MDYAPSRTFYLFSVNLPSVARLLVERAYHVSNTPSLQLLSLKYDCFLSGTGEYSVSQNV